MVLTKYGESSIIIINTDCDENRDARLICFSARFIIHFYLFVDEREDIQKRSFTKWINSQLSKVRLKTSLTKSNSDITRSTWGCKNELWQILYYNSGRKYSIISNIGNCHLFWWIISDYLVILEVVREMKIYNLGLI